MRILQNRDSIRNMSTSNVSNGYRWQRIRFLLRKMRPATSTKKEIKITTTGEQINYGRCQQTSLFTTLRLNSFVC